MADNQSQWPAQYPGSGWPAADQAPNGAAGQGQEQPTEPQVVAAPSPVPPSAQQAPPAPYPV
ncbi:MAG TPA: hypothetical protein VHO07_07935, partial [Streptosporangiaceae bacterium]|nr:hypothetical protein [Streptosporangiaceae bacterium]